MKYQKGQSLIELLVAMGVFVVVISSITFLVLDSYVSGRLSKEITQANFLAEEGIEAVRSIRDNSWSDLSAGTYGLAISGNNWILQGTQEDLSSELKQGTRTINIEEIDPDRKKITSQVAWKFVENRPQQIQLVTYLTNWQRAVIFCQGTCTPCSGFLTTKLCKKQDSCDWIGKDKICIGTCTPCDNFLDQRSCEAQSVCVWTGP